MLLVKASVACMRVLLSHCTAIFPHCAFDVPGVSPSRGLYKSSTDRERELVPVPVGVKGRHGHEV